MRWARQPPSGLRHRSIRRTRLAPPFRAHAPLPIYAVGNVSDVAATGALIQGFNDNVIQTTDGNGDIDRHPATFTGLEGTLTLRLTEPDTDVHGLRLACAGSTINRSTGTPPPIPTAPAGGYASSVTLGRFTQFSLSLSSTVTALTSRASATDALFTVDPSLTQTTFTLSTGPWPSCRSSQRWRFRLTGGAGHHDVAAPPYRLAGGQMLDRRGFDGFQPFTTASVLHDITPRDTGDISVMYRYTYAPYSIDLRQSPPRAAGEQRLHQVVPDVGLNHLLTPDWLSVSRLGLSIATPPNYTDSNKAVILPVASQEIHFTNERWTLVSSAAFSYGSVTPRLGAGPTLTGQAALTGVPYSYGKFRNLMATFRAVAMYANLQSSNNTTTDITAVGASAEGRYPLNTWLGVSAGLDVRLSTTQTSGGDLIPFFRQIAFIGLSGYWTTDGEIPVLQLLEAPFRPRRLTRAELTAACRRAPAADAAALPRIAGSG